MKENGGDKENYKHMRFGLASTLMFNGYSTYTTLQSWDHTAVPYTATWWYDEYAVNISTGTAEKSRAFKGYLGAPVSEAYNVMDHTDLLSTSLENNNAATVEKVWRRNFKNGIVLVNPSNADKVVALNGSYKKIKGIYDTDFNDGQTVRAITLAAESGLVLLSTN